MPTDSIYGRWAAEAKKRRDGECHALQGLLKSWEGIANLWPGPPCCSECYGDHQTEDHDEYWKDRPPQVFG